MIKGTDIKKLHDVQNMLEKMRIERAGAENCYPEIYFTGGVVLKLTKEEGLQIYDRKILELEKFLREKGVEP